MSAIPTLLLLATRLPLPPAATRHPTRRPCWRRRHIAIGTAVGVGIGGAATFFYLRQQRMAARPAGEGGGGASGVAAVAQHPALKHGGFFLFWPG
jgi:hypothetical protein